MIQGIVQDISSRTVATKWGDKPVFSITVDNNKYDGLWKNPTFQVGATVSFNSSTNKYGNKVEGEITVISSGNGTAPVVTGNATPNAAPQGARPTSPPKKYRCTCNQFPIDPLDSQMSIIQQSSIKIATEIVLRCIEFLPEAAKKKITATTIWDDIRALTPRIVDEASGQAMMEELLKEKVDKHNEYKKLLAGEQIDPASTASSDPVAVGGEEVEFPQ